MLVSSAALLRSFAVLIESSAALVGSSASRCTALRCQGRAVVFQRQTLVQHCGCSLSLVVATLCAALLFQRHLGGCQLASLACLLGLLQGCSTCLA